MPIQLRALAVRAMAAILSLLSTPALAVTDKRSVRGAAAEVGPSIPEPSSILLFVAGIAIVGYGVHRHRSKGH